MKNDNVSIDFFKKSQKYILFINWMKFSPYQSSAALRTVWKRVCLIHRLFHSNIPCFPYQFLCINCIECQSLSNNPNRKIHEHIRPHDDDDRVAFSKILPQKKQTLPVNSRMLCFIYEYQQSTKIVFWNVIAFDVFDSAARWLSTKSVGALRHASHWVLHTFFISGLFAF